jgi:hypothetical protein
MLLRKQHEDLHRAHRRDTILAASVYPAHRVEADDTCFCQAADEANVHMVPCTRISNSALPIFHN